MPLSQEKILKTIKFINLVRKFKCMYDDDARRRISQKEIDKIWEDIIDECELMMTVSQAKRKWAYLCNEYKKCLISRKQSTFHSYMDFMFDYVTSNPYDDEFEVSDHFVRERVDNHRASNRRERLSLPTTPTRPRQSGSRSRSRSPSRSMSNHNRTSSSRQSFLHQDNHSPSATFVSRNCSKCAVRNINTEPDDAITSYSKFVASSIRQLSRRLQIRVTNQIASILTKAELENLMINNQK